MILGMVYAINSAKAWYCRALQTLSELHRCCRGCMSLLAKVTGCLGSPLQRSTPSWDLWVRVVEQAQQAQVRLDKPQPAQIFWSGKVLGALLPEFFWRLWVGIQPWGPGEVPGITLPLTDFSLCPRFLFPFLLSPFIGHCLVRSVPTKILFFHLTFIPVCKACKLLHWPLGLLYSRVVVPPCGMLWVAVDPVFVSLPASGWLSIPGGAARAAQCCGSLLKTAFPNGSFFEVNNCVC